MYKLTKADKFVMNIKIIYHETLIYTFFTCAFI